MFFVANQEFQDVLYEVRAWSGGGAVPVVAVALRRIELRESPGLGEERLVLVHDADKRRERLSRQARAVLQHPGVVHHLREDARHVPGVPEVAVVLELEEDALGVVVDAAQCEDLHLEELAELGLDLLLLPAWGETRVEMLHARIISKKIRR